MLFLKSIKCTLIASFLIGIAPLHYEGSSNRIKCNTITLLYTIFIKTITSFCPMYILIRGWYYGEHILTMNTAYWNYQIIKFANHIMHTILILGSFSMFLVTTFTRHLNAKLINDLQHTDNEFVLLVADKHIRCFHKSVNIQLAAIFGYFLFSIVSFAFCQNCFHSNDVLLSSAIVFQYLSNNVNAIYMRHIAKLVTSRFGVLVLGLKFDSGYVPSDKFSLFCVVVKMIGKFDNLKNLSSRTFGWNFVIISAMEFCKLTVVIFTATIGDGNRLLVAIYTLPNIVIILVLVDSFNELG